MQKNLLLICCLLLVVLFVYTGVSKLADAATFRRDLNNQVFPKSWVPLLAWTLPIAEILVAIAICSDRYRLAGLRAAALLMFLFTLYTALVLAGVFNRVPCSCGGVIKRLSWQQHLWFNLGFLSISILAVQLCMHTYRRSRKPVTE